MEVKINSFIHFSDPDHFFLLVSDRFRAGIKDLEVMMQNVITTAFETAKTVEQGVELLDAFQHLSSREVRYICISLFVG